MIDLKSFEVWFVTGSQELYGPETLRQVAIHSETIAQALDAAPEFPVRVRFHPVLKTPDEILACCQAANHTPNCVGLITWMHTFSPAKMWINGLRTLRRPLAHLHTQFNRDIPWATIDMDFMNLNQAAHGDREYGFLLTRLRLNRKVVVGHWQEPGVRQRLAAWSRAAAAWHDWQNARFARLGDNMREVAVTEGDKVAAQIQFGYSVHGHGVGDLVCRVRQASDAEVNALVKDYEATYAVAADLRAGGARHESVREAARIELGLRSFLQDGRFKGFTTTFEDLHGLAQLPGLAVQRLMAEGYGFGAEGDWKTAALVRALKVMATGLPGGTSFMEDYTYHLHPDGAKVLGAHMLEICPSIADGRPTLEVHPLGIGGKADPARLVFNTPAGPGLNTSLIDLGNRFRLLVNEVEVVTPDAPLPRLPVARAVWKPQPNLAVAAAAWILAGGAHHTAFSQAVTPELLEDFAEMAGLEHVAIGPTTTVAAFKKELRWNEAAYALHRGWSG